MKHMTWVQDRTPACAIDAKTPYKMKNKKKPHLAKIQEFGVAAYVKGLKAGKLDACAKVSHFIGYDLESKGYHIYWPQKCTITIECNIMFNECNMITNDNVHIHADDVLDKGERDKVLQPPTSSATTPVITTAPQSQPKAPNITPELTDQPELQNSIPFLLEPQPVKEPLPELLQEEDPPLELG